MLVLFVCCVLLFNVFGPLLCDSNQNTTMKMKPVSLLYYYHLSITFKGIRRRVRCWRQLEKSTFNNYQTFKVNTKSRKMIPILLNAENTRHYHCIYFNEKLCLIPMKNASNTKRCHFILLVRCNIRSVSATFKSALYSSASIIFPGNHTN